LTPRVAQPLLWTTTSPAVPGHTVYRDKGSRVVVAGRAPFQVLVLPFREIGVGGGFVYETDEKRATATGADERVLTVFPPDLPFTHGTFPHADCARRGTAHLEVVAVSRSSSSGISTP
jgi:hypothetical protein